MSETVNCDNCGVTGKRQRFFPAPKNWFFFETEIELEFKKEIVFIYVCSSRCANTIWHVGPGKSFRDEVAEQFKKEHNLPPSNPPAPKVEKIYKCIGGYNSCSLVENEWSFCQSCLDDYKSDPDSFK